MSKPTIKIAVIGPTRAGKSALSNYLANISDQPSPNYDPTIGVRILEFEKDLGRSANSSMLHGNGRIRVELWDVSGDKRFESCWKAIIKDINGVLIVFNPDNPDDERQLDIWYNRFVEHGGIKDSQCIAFAHRPNAQRLGRVSLSSQRLSRVSVVSTSMEIDAPTIRSEFDKFLGNVVAAMSAQQGAEEDRIMS